MLVASRTAAATSNSKNKRTPSFPGQVPSVNTTKHTGGTPLSYDEYWNRLEVRLSYLFIITARK